MQELHDADALRSALDAGALEHVAVQSLDLAPFAHRLREVSVAGTIFMGCRAAPELFSSLMERGALVFPALPGVPYDQYPSGLYTVDALFADFDVDDPCTYCNTLDARIYAHWQKTGGAAASSIHETLARRLHDHAITDALDELVGGQKVVAIMGGHSMSRGSDSYRAVAEMSGELARRGYLMASGGGPGAMEATHLGVYFADRAGDLDEALSMLAEAPKYDHRDWLSAAMRVRARFPNESIRTSVGIPTWFYGHEPPNAFASHVAKYFANSVREEGLVTIATHGILFAPGKAGTVQEIFQDAAQNHYGTVEGKISPMALFGVDYWTQTYPVKALLDRLSNGRPYSEMMVVDDDPNRLVQFIVDNPPREVKTGWSFCGEYCS